MATGTSACIHLRNIQNVRNEACSTPRRGLVQTRLPRFSRRNIHTICSNTMPLRSTRKLWLLDPIIAGNQSAPEGHRPTTGAHYSTTRPPLLESVINKIVSKKNQADDLPHDSQRGKHLLSKNGPVIGGGHGDLKKKSQAVSLETRVLAQLSEDRSRSANCEGDELAQEAFGEHGSRMSLTWLENSLKGLQEDLQKSQRDLLNQPQQFTSAQIATVQLPIQRDVLSTIDKNARKVLEHANRDMLWAESSRRKDQLQSQQIPLVDPEYVVQRTAELLRFKHNADTCYSPHLQEELKRKKLELPVRRFTKQILEVINSNTYTIIDGKCDSGKTTQVPQIILDDAIDNSTGASCRVLCVQLKELEAVKKSLQVAHERLEKLGDTTFYGVAPDHNTCTPFPGGNIRYCSRDDLLRMLKNGPSSLERFSHIILDEVQLRDFNIEAGMMLLKRFVEQRKSIGASVPKVILMGSITHVDSFCSYFGTKTIDGTLLPAPHLTIPMGFPVEKYYLEEVIGNIAHSLTPNTLWPLLLNDKNTKEFLDNHFKLFEESETVEINRLGKVVVPCGLISATLLSLLSTTKTGSILVFVPTIPYMQRVIKQITAYGPEQGFHFADKNRFRIIQLHKNTTKEEKAEFNLELPPGCRRIVISTQGKGFTIPDVRYVIDSGKSIDRKENHENHENSNNLAKNNGWAVRWTSQTVASQRAEHAGRVQGGEYYFLGAKKCFDSLPVTKPPTTGAARSDLQRACLHVKRATSGTSLSIAELFAQTYEPPQESSVCAAVDDLKELQALDEQEELTTLGHLLVDLDMDPCFGKMVALGIIFQCLDPMLILAGLGWNPRLLLHMPSSPDAGAGGSLIGSVHDSVHESGYHIATINAFGAIREMLHKEGKLPAFEDAVSKDYMSKVYQTATSEINRIIKRLIAAKIIPADRLYGEEGSWLSCSSFNANSNNEALIEALLLQCLSSNLAVKPFGDTTFKFKSGEIINRISDDFKHKSYIMAYNFRSVSASMPHGMTQKTQVNPLAACLLGNKIEQEEDNVILDSWVKIELQSVESTENEVARSLVQTHRVLNETLRTAFQILPCQRMANFDSKTEWVSYLKERSYLFKTIQNTLQDILHANDPPMPTRKGI